jgi:hypothetical protein
MGMKLLTSLTRRTYRRSSFCFHGAFGEAVISTHISAQLLAEFVDGMLLLHKYSASQ